jgi:hypothetical protein
MSLALRILCSLALLIDATVALADPTSPEAQGFHVSGPATAQIAAFASPAVPGDVYAVTGTVAYEGVEGDGYLEMWSEFPDGSRYFSRTLDEQGPLAVLRGSSPERPFALPFLLPPDSPRPTRLEVNVVLPAGGKVTVRGLRLGSGAEAMRAPGAWWSPEAAGWIGGAAGGAVGLFGALVGTLCSLGRGRRFVLAGLVALGVSGLALLAAGGVALGLGQPYEVWYPLVLMGILDPVLAVSLLPTARRRFEALELRRMQALDTR